MKAEPAVYHDDFADEVRAQLLGVQVVLVWCNPIEDGRRRIDSQAQLEAELPQRLRNGARVLKQHRGHSGIGVWRVEQAGDGSLTVQHAQRDRVAGFGGAAHRFERVAENV